MRIKKIAAIFMLVVMTLSMAACRSSNSKENVTTEEPTTTEEQTTTEAQTTTEEPTTTEPETIISEESKNGLEDIIEYVGDVEEYFKKTGAVLSGMSDAESSEDFDVIIGELDKIYSEICAMKEAVENIKDADYEEIQVTFDVAKQYFSELESCYGDLLQLVKFTGDYNKMCTLYLTMDDMEGATVEEAISMLISMFSTFGSEFSKLDYPEYMKQSVDNIVSGLDDYITVLRGCYTSIINEDYLKMSATKYMQYYSEEKFTLSIQSLLSDAQMQIAKIMELFDGRMKTYQDELKENTSKQLEELVKPKYTHYNEAKKPTISYTYEDTIYPATYSILDSVVKLVASCDQGECDVIVKVEIPEFAISYEQKVSLHFQLTQLYIKPIIDSTANLDFQKTAQMKVTVTDADTGKVYVQDSNNITIMSKNDLELFDVGGEDGSCYNVLAWMTPESDAILNLKRTAIDWLTLNTEGVISNLVGYQGAANLEEALIKTMYQACALQNAMSALGVRYNMDSYSSSTGNDALQRVMYPSEVMENKSGICIETSLVIASALQSAEFNVMLIIPPGHCFVAVEVWPGSGEYLSIETTCLPTSSYSISDYITYLTKEEWQAYIDNKGCTVIDCSLAREIGFVPYFN